MIYESYHHHKYEKSKAKDNFIKAVKGQGAEHLRSIKIGQLASGIFTVEATYFKGEECDTEYLGSITLYSSTKIVALRAFDFLFNYWNNKQG